jgi:hypothetical protein
MMAEYNFEEKTPARVGKTYRLIYVDCESDRFRWRVLLNMEVVNNISVHFSLKYVFPLTGCELVYTILRRSVGVYCKTIEVFSKPPHILLHTIYMLQQCRHSYSQSASLQTCPFLVYISKANRRQRSGNGKGNTVDMGRKKVKQR